MNVLHRLHGKVGAPRTEGSIYELKGCWYNQQLYSIRKYYLTAEVRSRNLVA
jgi:hypothetical protein